MKIPNTLLLKQYPTDYELAEAEHMEDEKLSDQGNKRVCKFELITLTRI